MKKMKFVKKGRLLIVGGHEDKSGETEILKAVAERVGRGKLCVVTVASKVGHELWEEYAALFRSLGVKRLSWIDASGHTPELKAKARAALEGATAAFITGGDQLKLTSELGGSVVAEGLDRILEEGGLIAGTSAGASVMSETMLVAGPGQISSSVGSELRMAPGLGWLKNAIVDQHFAQRGRMGRLLAAVSHNPRCLGIGIDENTAILVEDGHSFSVLGAGSVYVVDGHGRTSSNISEAAAGRSLSVFNVCLHALSAGDSFDLRNRQPVEATARTAAA